MIEVVPALSPLERLFHARIAELGPLTVRDLMEWALYHPEHGYYTRSSSRETRFEDFYTAPALHPAFGRALARQFAGLWKKFSFDRFSLVEAGSGQGQLAYDILKALSDQYPEIFELMTYVCVERSPARREESEKRLVPFRGKTIFLESVEQLPVTHGIIFSNELLDSFPVHCLERDGEGLKEVHVAAQGGELTEVLLPLSSAGLARDWEEWGYALEEGQRAEANRDALRWLKSVSEKLLRGALLTIDYGGTALELARSQDGSLRTFHDRNVGRNILEKLGEKDITSSVNFTSLMREGEKAGLTTACYTTQSKFLLDSGIAEDLPQGQDAASYKERTRIKTLFHPDGMGERFKVLLQVKN